MTVKGKKLYNRRKIKNYGEELRIANQKSKSVPLHAMEAHGGRGGIAPTHT
jgi:hypothetical protein